MGLIISKFSQKSQDQDQDETGTLPSTPILTPKVNCREKVDSGSGALDPRSPSRHISRTPIELVSLTTSKQQSPTLHIATNGALEMETPLKNHIILGIDPRSPSMELNRTPIIVDNTSPKLPQQLKNKNLDKVRNGEMKSFTPNIEKISRTLTIQVTPKNIRADLNKRKSLVLLETNIDYTETHLDDVIREKYPVVPSENSSVADVCDPHSLFTEMPILTIAEDNQTDQLRLDCYNTVTPQKCNKGVTACIEKTEEILEDYSEEVEDCTTVDDIESGADNIKTDEPENTQIIPEDAQTELDDGQGVEHNDSVILPETDSDVKLVLEDVDKNIEAEEPEINPSEGEGETKNFLENRQSVSEPTLSINLTADVNELDKKLTNLIYEDEELVVCPKMVKHTGKAMQNRTPLGQRQCGSENSKSMKLKVSDKPRKSQIPLFKDKKIKVQCENTPPKTMRQAAKAKKPQWDLKNDTLVI